MCRIHIHTDVGSAYTNIFANEHFFIRCNTSVIRTQDWTQWLHSDVSNWLLLSHTSNYKQGKNNSGVRLDWIFAASNSMFESGRIVCVAGDAPNLWHFWREHSGQSSSPVALRRLSLHSATDLEHSFSGISKKLCISTLNCSWIGWNIGPKSWQKYL